MWDLRACVVCLSTAHKLYNLDEHGLREDYNVVAGLNVCYCLNFFNSFIFTHTYSFVLNCLY